MTDKKPEKNPKKTTDNKTGIMICGHGSRDGGATVEFNSMVKILTKRLPQYDVDSGFLEFARPVIRTGLEALVRRGAKRIICIPSMLFAAGHVKNDLPSEFNNFAADNPGIEVIYARDLGVEAKLLAAAKERIEEAERNAGSDISRDDTLLMVVGRGTNDPDANSSVSKVARMLWEGMGMGWAEVSYSGVAYPLVDAGMARAAKLGFKRIIVFPYFLFTGILVRRIYTWVDEAVAANPDIEIIKAGYINDHPFLVDCFVERIEEVFTGNNLMNCRLCKYREQIIGFENDVGTPQVGHHHHVRGIGSDSDHHHHHHSHGDKDRE